MAKVNWRNTNILFDVLHKFNLSLTQYVIADIIARQSAQFNGWTSIADGSLAEILKVSRPTISDNIDKLVELGLIAKREGGGNGMHVPKKATELWWAAVNEVEDYKKDTCKENLQPCKETLQPCKKTLQGCKESLQGCKETLHYSNSIDNNISNNTTFSEEKGSSEKTEVFSPPTENKKIAAKSNVKKTLFSQDENQKEKEKNCGKKEKAETPETEGEDYLTAGQLPTYNQLQIKPELWAAFVGAVVKRLPTQKPKNKIKRSIFVSWATKLKAIENKFADMVIISHFQDYQDKGWTSPFFPGYAETLQKAQKDYNFTNQNNNNQNATTQSTIDPTNYKRREEWLADIKI